MEKKEEELQQQYEKKEQQLRQEYEEKMRLVYDITSKSYDVPIAREYGKFY